MTKKTSKERFSDRVDNYIKYRPNYADTLIERLREDFGLRRSSVVADVGSGTGILSKSFLRNGNRVFGVEPNEEMRRAAERLLAEYSGFISIAASAEETTLGEGSIDFIAAGQAFHWFDLPLARTEFMRILKPEGWVVLIWNDRRTDSTVFLQEYENFLRTFGLDYQQVDHKQVDDRKIGQFFDGAKVRKLVFDNFQQLDFDGLKGRVLSSSYMPMPGHQNYDAMVEAMCALFQRHEIDGQIRLDYDTNMYLGRFRT